MPASELKTEEFQSHRPYTKFPAMDTKLDDRIENKPETKQKMEAMNKRRSSIPSNDQDQMMKTLTNLSSYEKSELLESIDWEVVKLTEKFNEVINTSKIRILFRR